MNNTKIKMASFISITLPRILLDEYITKLRFLFDGHPPITNFLYNVTSNHY